MKRITLLFLVFMFLFIRPQQLYQRTLFYQDDDHDYFARATSIAYGQFPSYEKENYHSGANQPLGSIGPGIMASPFVFLFSWIDAFSGSSICERRTEENMIHSWSLFGFVVSTTTYFWLACLLLYHGLIKHVKKNTAFWAILLVVFCQGIPLYAFSRPVFSHMYEFFLQSLMMYWFMTFNDEKRSRVNILISTLIGCAAGMIFLVRFNNMFFALAWPSILLWKRGKEWRASLINMTIAYFVLASAIGFHFWLYYIKPTAGYTGFLTSIITLKEFSYYPSKIFHIFFGLDWGLVYTLPLCLFGLAACFKLSFPEKKRLLLICLPLLVSFVVLVQMKAQGAWYGYRHIMPPFIPLMVLPAAIFMRQFPRLQNKLILIVLAFFPLMSMILFDANSQLRLFIHHGWNNPKYQLLVWKTVIFDPVLALIALTKGGLLYIFYPIALHFPDFPNPIPAWDMEFIRTIVSDKSTMIKYAVLMVWPIFWLVFIGVCRFLFIIGRRYTRRVTNQQTDLEV